MILSFSSGRYTRDLFYTTWCDLWANWTSLAAEQQQGVRYEYGNHCSICRVSLEPHIVLQIWWSRHLIMFLLIHVLSPLCIYYCAMRQYPEFNGLKARRFPGQEQPRRQVLIPRREIFIEKEKCEELNIKARARKKGAPKTVFIRVLPIIRE